jgi:hypothetical protein
MDAKQIYRVCIDCNPATLEESAKGLRKSCEETLYDETEDHYEHIEGTQRFHSVVLCRRGFLSQAWCDKGTESLKHQLAPVIEELKQEFTLHMEVGDASAEVDERQREVSILAEFNSHKLTMPSFTGGVRAGEDAVSGKALQVLWR